MSNASASGWSRRDFAGGVAFLALALGVPVAAVKLSHLDEEDAPTERQRLLMREVSQMVIPRTATAGAGDVGTGDFVILALAHGLEGARAPFASGAMPSFQRFVRRDGSLRQMQWLEHELDRRAGGDFLRGSAADRVAILSAVDAEAFAEGSGDSPWRTVKALILTGYYTSEEGGSKELNYELVPGRWDSDLPLKPGMKAYSSDWTAVDFG